jgi:hypothetical protein
MAMDPKQVTHYGQKSEGGKQEGAPLFALVSNFRIDMPETSGKESGVPLRKRALETARPHARAPSWAACLGIRTREWNGHTMT